MSQDVGCRSFAGVNVQARLARKPRMFIPELGVFVLPFEKCDKVAPVQNSVRSESRHRIPMPALM